MTNYHNQTGEAGSCDRCGSLHPAEELAFLNQPLHEHYWTVVKDIPEPELTMEHREHAEFPWWVRVNGQVCAMFKHEITAHELMSNDPRELFYEDVEHGGLLYLRDKNDR